MDFVKRWGPIIAGLVLAVTAILRALGYADVAQAIETLGGLVGLTSDPVVSQTELAAAVGLLAGIVLKVKSQVDKARAAQDTVDPRRLVKG